MPYCSRSVSGQIEAIHPNLEATLKKHLAHDFRRPIQHYNETAINWARQQWQNLGQPPIILDSGCGIGESTFNLSQSHPKHLVIGIDQSQHRLAKSGLEQSYLVKDNLLLLRADLVDCWRILVREEWLPEKHYILYPNPWPKKKHLQRRWHGHPVFKSILQLGGELELRSNWKTYVDEFAFSLRLAFNDPSIKTQPYFPTQVFSKPNTPKSIISKPSTSIKSSPQGFLTPFEKKYALSDQQLFRLHFCFGNSCMG
ncbi:MAG: hypothetical protein MI976_18075 [Pseudomonadales bacterium]|nr:hypothetical protein [Pseudomonadales bacterium]